MAALQHCLPSTSRPHIPSTRQTQPCSTSQPSVCPRSAGLHSSARPRPLPPCRITNTSDEIYRALQKEIPTGDPDEFIYVDEMQVHYPELGPLENRVGKQYLQELFNDSGVDVEETAYWFHTPPGGWQSQPVAYRAAEEAPITFPEPEHLDAETSGRTPMDQLEEGQVITGVITDCWLYHGIQVDFGAAFDGLVWITQDAWMEPGARETLLPDEEVQCVVHKLRQPGLYRWPIQLRLLEPSWLASVMPDPDHYPAPINHEWCEDQGMEPEDIARAAGRPFDPPVIMMPESHAEEAMSMELAYGYDDPENDHEYEDAQADWRSTTGQKIIDDLVAELP